MMIDFGDPLVGNAFCGNQGALKALLLRGAVCILRKISAVFSVFKNRDSFKERFGVSCAVYPLSTTSPVELMVA